MVGITDDLLKILDSGRKIEWICLFYTANEWNHEYFTLQLLTNCLYQINISPFLPIHKKASFIIPYIL